MLKLSDAGVEDGRREREEKLRSNSIKKTVENLKHNKSITHADNLRGDSQQSAHRLDITTT